MAVMKSDDGLNIFVDCVCGCCNGVRFRIDKDEYNYYTLMTYMEGCKKDTSWRVFRKKFEKIWAIIRNKDYYYSDILMTKDEFETFKEHINKF